MKKQLQALLDCDVTLYVGRHVFKGSIGESEDDEILVLHTVQDEMMNIRISRIDAYVLHPYVADVTLEPVNQLTN